MASKSKLQGLIAMHTSGIYSDMTVDGPDIGTLVVIVDRAKNLPNRKTIGKQDPYCAARLGKEAKKTDTDRRGGQTPRWDQELRYTVHDSPDYYQLKVQVFNDDKKTDLIGETWVDLKEIIVPGGGQNDLWHNLNCKGKYAGEIRIEITYYDARPKHEKPEKTKQIGTSGMEQDASKDSLRGPRQAKSGVKRRPLPSDPVTGEPANTPVAAPDHVPTVDYVATPTRSYLLPSTVPDHVQTAAPDHVPTPPRGYPLPSSVPDYVQNLSRGYLPSPNAVQEYSQTPSRGYQAPPNHTPEYVQTPQRGYSSPNHIPAAQSTLQRSEYNTPPLNASASRGYDTHASGYNTPPRLAVQQQSHTERFDLYDSRIRNEYNHGSRINPYDEEEDEEPRDEHELQHVPYEIPPVEEFGSPPSPGGPPPPPPVHRSLNGSSHVNTNPAPAPAPAVLSSPSYGFPQESQSNQFTTSHDNSRPPYIHSQSYKAYSPERDQSQYQHSSNGSYQVSLPRHHSYDSRYQSDYGSMQPTVEDVPDSPAAGGRYPEPRGNDPRAPDYDDQIYDKVPSPAPLNLTGQGTAASGRKYSSSAQAHHPNGSIVYSSTNPQSPTRERSEAELSTSSLRSSYNSNLQQDQRSRDHSDDHGRSSANYGMPQVPATLVPGIDPMIAQEISKRIYDETRATSSSGLSPRGSYQNSPNQQAQQHPTPTHALSYDDRPSRFSTASVTAIKPQAVSPDNRRATTRKSVSPSPVVSGDQRRFSGVPFGPDSYNALNPVVSASTSTPSLSAAYSSNDVDPDTKIITHDGREIDPSDHIPESNYAPLLESKGPRYASQQPDRNYRPQPTPQHPTPERKILRQAGRLHSTCASPPAYSTSQKHDPLTTPGRNRLQKKAHRISTQPAPYSSPLAPISPQQDKNLSPKSIPTTHTMHLNSGDYTAIYGSSPKHGVSYPIPAKISIDMSEQGPMSRSGENDAWALLEEMKSINLGHGSSRPRRRAY